MERVILERLAMVDYTPYTIMAVARDGSDHTQVLVSQGDKLIASVPYQNRAPDEALDMALDDLDLIVRRLPLSHCSRLPVYVMEDDRWREW